MDWRNHFCINIVRSTVERSCKNKKTPLFLKIFERWGSGGRKLSKKVFFPHNKKTTIKNKCHEIFFKKHLTNEERCGRIYAQGRRTLRSHRAARASIGSIRYLGILWLKRRLWYSVNYFCVRSFFARIFLLKAWRCYY